MEKKTPQTSQRGLTMQRVFLEMYVCGFLQTLHFGTARFRVLVQIALAGDRKLSRVWLPACLARVGVAGQGSISECRLLSP